MALEAYPLASVVQFRIVAAQYQASALLAVIIGPIVQVQNVWLLKPGNTLVLEIQVAG